LRSVSNLERATVQQIVWLATRDLLHQALASLVLIVALAAVLTPLLVRLRAEVWRH